MPVLTRREQFLVAFVLLAFCAGFGIKQWRGLQAITGPAAAAEAAR